jgi:HSP20 family protein
MANKSTSIERSQDRSDQRMTRRQPAAFDLMQQMTDEMDRLFAGFGFGPSWMPRFGLGGGLQRSAERVWNPAIEVFQRGDHIVVRAELPGLRRDDVNVTVTEDMITIEGERRHEQEEEQEGFYRSERSYGRFSRRIALPEGAMADQAKATFRDGVLEVTVPAPPEQAARGRRIEIQESSPERGHEKAQEKR